MAVLLDASSSQYCSSGAIGDWFTSTWCCWFKCPDDSSTRTLINLGKIGFSGKYRWSFVAPVPLIKNRITDASNSINSEGSSASGDWQSLVVEVSGSTSIEAWIDGVSLGSDSVGAAMSMPAGSDFFIGAAHGAAAPNNYGEGWIGEVAVWNNTTLASESIAALAAGAYPNTIPEAGSLSVYWPMEDDFADAVGSNDLTANNGAAIDSDHPTMHAYAAAAVETELVYVHPGAFPV